jgi:hypothetical protein
MAAPINSPSTGDIWHLCIDDLLAPLPDKARLGGPGPFVINLSASTAPIDLPNGAIAGCQQGHVYQVQRTEDRRLRYRLRFGPITSEDEADAILEKLRDVYPSALTATADADDLRAIAAIQAKVIAHLAAAAKAAEKAAPKPAVKVVEKPVEKVAEKVVLTAPSAAVPSASPMATSPATSPTPTLPSPVMLSTPQAPKAEEARQTEIPTVLAPPVLAPPVLAPPVLAPPVLSMEQEVIRERAPVAPPVSPVKAVPAIPPVAAAPSTSTRKRVSSAVSMIPLLTTVATSSIKRVISKPALSSARTAPVRAMPHTQPKMPAATAAPIASPASLTAAPPKPTAVTPVAAAVPNSAPTVAAPPASAAAPVEQLSLRSLGLETTQTVRALTAVELEDDESLRWFVIQLSMADEPFDSETVPNLDIFTLYRLYCVAGVDQGRVVHTLRLGFFSEEIAAGAVASYLAEFYENPIVKRVSVAERQRFADQRFEPRKDVGATGKQAVIEITNERYIREKRVTAAGAHPPASQRSR